MFDWLKSLFGEGKVRIEFTTFEGRNGIARVPYIGSYDEVDLLKQFKRVMKVDHGLTVRTATVLGNYTT